MDDLCQYAERPIAFIGRYLRRHPYAHIAILTAVIGAVLCSVGAQYGLKALIDALTYGPSARNLVSAFALLAILISADNLLWRLAGWVGSYTFVRVTGDLRSDLFRHLTGHAPTYFSDRLPGMLTSRITATSNAVYTMESMFVSNVLPPLIATIGATAIVLTVNAAMAGVLVIGASIGIAVMFRLAAAGKPLHHSFASKAAAVDGEMVDVISNLPLVHAFCGIGREHHRFEETVGREMDARRQSLIHLERLRLLHAIATVLLAIGLMLWAITLWQHGGVTVGQVVLVCTLGLSVLHATRDLAVALVDVTQHLARLSEALATLLYPHALCDAAEATPLVPSEASIVFDDVRFGYPGGQTVFDRFSLRVEPGERVGIVGASGRGKSTLIALLQRFYDVDAGRILIGGQDIARVTQESLRSAISVVPQDISLLHRSVMENILYGRPDATEAEVRAAAEAARCDFIDDLPEGLATVVGDRGVKLSGGQRQRIAIARAFLKQAPILLLDEATSAVDSKSEKLIHDALDRLMRGRTVLSIAHRPTTLRGFDRIIDLDQIKPVRNRAREFPQAPRLRSAHAL
jgi:ATP-binding cassette, subfamily B, bacterial